MQQKRQYTLSTEAYEKLCKVAKWEKRTMSATVELLILEKYETLKNQCEDLSIPKNRT